MTYTDVEVVAVCPFGNRLSFLSGIPWDDSEESILPFDSVSLSFPEPVSVSVLYHLGSKLGFIKISVSTTRIGIREPGGETRFRPCSGEVRGEYGERHGETGSSTRFGGFNRDNGRRDAVETSRVGGRGLRRGGDVSIVSSFR